MKAVVVLLFSAVLFAQEKPAPQKEPATIKMSDSAAAKILKAQVAAMAAVQNFQDVMAKVRLMPQYKAAERAQEDAIKVFQEVIEAERKSAKAEGHEPDVEAQVWKRKVEAAKK